jgi:hypothetical protein
MDEMRSREEEMRVEGRELLVDLESWVFVLENSKETHLA